MRFLKLKRFWLLLFCLIILGLLVSCSGTRTLMMQAPNKPRGEAAEPAISLETVKQGKADLQTHIFGPIPTITSAELSDIRLITDDAFNGSARVEEFTVTAGYGAANRPFHVVLVSPQTAEPVPVIMMQNFCPNHSVIPVEGVSRPSGSYFNCDGDGMMSNVFGYFFGRYITTPPTEMIMKRGYALAVMYPHEFVPDNRADGLAVLGSLFPEMSEDDRPAALGVWASQFSYLTSVLDEDERFSDIITYGHSRFGKTALIAAAYDARIDGVIAHQSGTGGASLLKDKHGESIAQITQSYPHWFTPKFASYSEDTSGLPVDAHHLLAAIAPRPILLGNAKRDVWSDPNGAFRAAQAASIVYKAKGSSGLTQPNLKSFDPAADIAFWMRPGTHGVVKEDWPAFLEFLDAHFW